MVIPKFKKPKFLARFNGLQLIALFGLIIVGISLLPQAVNIKKSLTLLSHASPAWVFVAIIFCAISYIFAAATYTFLFPRPLEVSHTALVQLGVSYVNRLIPAGLGGASLNLRYQTKAGFSAAEAGSIVSANTAIGVISYFLVTLVTSFVLDVSVLSIFRASIPLWVLPTALIFILSAALVVQIVKKFHAREKKILAEISSVLIYLAAHPSRAALALLSSTLITLAYVLVLFATTTAVGVHLGLPAVFLVYLGGSAANSVAPTPSGIGVVEAAMIASFVAIGVNAELATASVLLYRLITFWLPILPGYLATRYAIANQII